jgi:hypothetical protein
MNIRPGSTVSAVRSPESKAEPFQFHTHICRGCESTWKHYSASGFTALETPSCRVCQLIEDEKH